TMHHITSFILSFFFSSRRRHTRSKRDWSSDVCSSDLIDHLFGIVARSACVPQRQWRHSVGVHVLGGALQLRERCDRDPRVLGLLVVDLEQYGLVGLDDQRAITHTSLYTCLLAGVVRCVAAGDRLSSGSCRTVRALLPLDCRAVIGGRRSNGIRRAIPAVSEDARMVRSDSG